MITALVKYILGSIHVVQHYTVHMHGIFVESCALALVLVLLWP